MASTSLAISFSSPSGESQAKGPYPALRFDVDALRELPGKAIIARHEQHAWFVGDEKYVRIDCDGPVSVHFEHADGTLSPSFGPYQSISFVDDMAYADHNVFAYADPDPSVRDWYFPRSREHWRHLIIKPA